MMSSTQEVYVSVCHVSFRQAARYKLYNCLSKTQIIAMMPVAFGTKTCTHQSSQHMQPKFTTRVPKISGHGVHVAETDSAWHPC
eukprot:2042263-Amphidinium_carterae.1